MEKILDMEETRRFMESAPKIHYCQQCGEDMGNEWILGPVCGKCCKANHRKVLGKR